MNKFETAVKILEDELHDAVLELKVPKPRKAYINLKHERHREAVSLLLKKVEDSMLSTISGVDLGKKIEINYHMACGGSITLKNIVSKEKPVTQTITDILPGADLYEREVFDLLGVTFEGHPNLKRLLLPETWPKGNYPLRRDWKPPVNQQEEFSSEEDLQKSSTNVDTDSAVTVIVGPQHPVLHEPERFSFKIDGETVVDVEPRLGYVHRGIEKAAEGMTYSQNVFLVERICGICNAAHTTVFCQAVEDIGNIETQSRAL
jgi:formate hydrogenlyase subunit 5